MPEWVHVWFWLRAARGVATKLPQQERPPGDPEAMSMEAYELFRSEWVAAGAPRVRPDAMAALYEPVPF